jgi:hypothetical protein
VYELNVQMYSVLMALCQNEALDIIVGSGSGNGLEAWRRLQRRYDPSTVGRSRGLLREILVLPKANVKELRRHRY